MYCFLRACPTFFPSHRFLSIALILLNSSAFTDYSISLVPIQNWILHRGCGSDGYSEGLRGRGGDLPPKLSLPVRNRSRGDADIPAETGIGTGAHTSHRAATVIATVNVSRISAPRSQRRHTDMWDLRFSRRWLWRMVSSGMLRRVAYHPRRHHSSI
jgi:hypothetical protein